jgi:poly(3-hydroxybutyrate) depolymerase
MGLTAVWPVDATAQTLSSGPQVLTFFSTVDDTDQPYAIYLPPNFDATRQYPLVMSLHGAGSNHRLNLRRVFGKSNAEGENDVEATRYFPEWEDVDYIVAAPYARGTMGYQGVAEKDVLDVLADVKRRFPIDPNRVYLTGLSMGGGGSLWIGLTRPDIWAAIAPVCPAPPAGTMDLAGNALNIPVHLYQGGADPVVSPESVRAWHTAFDSLGTQVEYTEYPGVGHTSWENAYAGGQIFDVFDQYERNPYPDRVRFTTRRYKYDTAYWIRIDALTPGTEAHIDAAFTDANQLDVTTSELGGFTLHLAEHPRVEAGQPMDVQINEQALTVTASDSLPFSRQDEGWVAEPYDRGEHAKRPGAEGPISAAVAKRHIYVYGTADTPSEAELQARRERAVTAATWSVYRGPFWRRVKVFPRVVADANVRESDFETSNLVLFGTASTNRIINQYRDQLPLHLDSTATDTHGLVFTFPVGEQQVLVSSGLPWWQTQAGSGSPFAQQVPALTLSHEVDYRLFRARADSVLVKGRFTQSWALPDSARRTLEQSGVVRTDQPVAHDQP